VRLSLYKESIGIDRGSARNNWDRFRKSAKCRPVQETLASMAGSRQRCAYCSDSHASDIDHFKPIAMDYTGTFRWLNMLWVCTRCNRAKGARFPQDETGRPTLINPTVIDPWTCLTLDTATGVISARFHHGAFDPRGESTLDILQTINYEAVAEGRLRIARRLIEMFDEVLANNDSTQIRREIARRVREDDMGIARWFGLWVGGNEKDVSIIRRGRPEFWHWYIRISAS